MKKVSKKKITAKKAGASVKTRPASAAAAQGHVSNGVVDKQPQVKEQAAVAGAMFLHADDAWALRYFDQSDLHFLEREVFG
jgi:cytochrome c5